MACPRCRLIARFHVQRDVDYVQAFQDLGDVQLQIRRHGPSLERWLERGRLERAVGNYLASHACFVEAYRLDPENPELHFHVGQALVYLALLKADLLPLSPATIHDGQGIPDDPADVLLSEAVDAFLKVLELNPIDQDAEDLVHELGQLLDSGLDVLHVHA